MRKLLLFFILISSFFFSIYSIQAIDKKNDVFIYFFHSNSCSHCKKEERLLKNIKKKYDNVIIRRYEIHDDGNKKLLESVKELYHITSLGVPVTVIGDTIYVGFSSDKSVSKFIKTIEYYSRYSYHNRVGEKVLLKDYFIQGDVNHHLSLEEFSKKEFPSSLFGIQLEELDESISASLLGFLTEINFFFFLSIIVLIIISEYLKNKRDKLFYFLGYFISSFLLRIGTLIGDRIVVIGILMFFVMFFFLRKRNKLSFMMILVIFLAIFKEYGTVMFYGEYFLILKNVVLLRFMQSANLALFYGNYFVVIILLYFLFMMIMYIILKKFKKILRR